MKEAVGGEEAFLRAVLTHLGMFPAPEAPFPETARPARSGG